MSADLILAPKDVFSTISTLAKQFTEISPAFLEKPYQPSQSFILRFTNQPYQVWGLMSNSLKAHLAISGERLVAFEADEISVVTQTEFNRDPTKSYIDCAACACRRGLHRHTKSRSAWNRVHVRTWTDH